MGFRSFLKRLAAALKLRKNTVAPSRVNPWEEQDTINRIKQGLLIAAAQRDSIQILDHLHELSLWSSPPLAIKSLQAQAVQLIAELEHKNLSTNANPSAILALRESILAENQQREAESRAAAESHESIDDLQRAAWQQPRDDDDQFHRRQAQQVAEAERRRHEHDRLAEEQAEGEAEARAKAERLEQERIAAAERAEAERLRQKQERIAKEQAEAETEAKAEVERLEQERLEKTVASWEEPGMPSPASSLDLEPLAEDLIHVHDAEEQSAEQKQQVSPPPNWLEASIDSLSLSIRANNALHRGGYTLIRDLCGKQTEDLLSIRNFGLKSLEQLQKGLSDQGIPFPVPSVTSATTADPSNNPRQTSSHQHTSHQDQQSLLTNREAAAIILEEADACIAFMKDSPEKRIQDLLSRSDVNRIHPATQVELNILKQSITIIESILNPKYLESDASQLAWFFTKHSLIRQFGVQLESNSTRSWIKKLQKSIRQNEGRDWEIYLQRACELSLQAIGDRLTPPITRERVRQILRRTSAITGRSAEDLAQKAKDRAEEQGNAKRSKVFESWIDQFGRLPYQDDLRPSDTDQSLWKFTVEQNPLERLHIYNKFRLPVPSKEWDLHYQWICKSNQPVGNGYWQEFEHLRHFLLRHAEALGNKEAMPKQTSLPSRVGGIVQNFGGQSKVAERVGLLYQGQLVGDKGRTYWTDERLLKLIDDVNIYHEQDISNMPTTVQIYEFFRNQKRKPYAGKNPVSPIAAITKQGRLLWHEAANRFNKKLESAGEP